ncbi:MAG: hypothetical protein ACLFQ7_07470 [Phormidium sp.]
MYSMNDGMTVAKRASRDIEAWLNQIPETLGVENVEDDPEYQQMDVDLLWHLEGACLKVEIKGDRYHKTGNFFFETHSNHERGTPGCFLYTEADWLFYYFVTPRTLYQLPMPETRDWFLKHRQQFRERSTRTPVGSGFYTTVGRLVPIAQVLAEVPRVVRVQFGT